MDRIETLVIRAPTVTPQTACAEVYELFSRDDDLLAIAVVDDGRPCGLVNRHELILTLADRFGRPLFERKPITRLMDPQPLIVEAEHHIDFLSQLILDERPAALMQGFIITQEGRYLGIGTALSLFHANMERAKQRSVELERAKAAAESANRAKTMFLANMSHELRTPLNAIIGFTDFIRTETLGPIQPPEYADYINDVNESGKHLLNVINAILDMSKVEANRIELREDYLDPAEIAEAASRMMRETASRRGITIGLETAHAPKELYADSQLVRQILLNLLSNALKFAGESKEVNLAVRCDDEGACVFSVIDHGIGIAQSEIKRVLEPFTQVESSHARTAEGTGLGLPLCAALAKAHGGRLEIESAVGRGTRVDIYFPPERTVRRSSNSSLQDTG